MNAHDRVLSIDLSSRTSVEERLPEEVMGRYLGGRALGAYLLARTLPPDADPLGDANPLILSRGPLQGTQAPFSSKTVLTCQSPLTGIYLYSLASSGLGHAIAGCGYQAVIVTGRAAAPCYVSIRDGRVEFRDAAFLWGEPTSRAQSAILNEIGDPEASVAVIGPAGERLVRFANVITGGSKMRTFGRGGAGAVMGSKRLKGLAIRGTHPAPVQDPAGLRDATRRVTRAIAGRREWAQTRRRLGTTTSLATLQEYGMLPTRNWQREVFDGFERLAPVMHPSDAAWTGKSIACAALCPAPCAREYRVHRGDYAGADSQGPDYETLYALGTECGIDRFDAVVAADRLCDEMGMDSMSAGVVIGFAMECAEKGLIESPATVDGGIRFGNDRALLTLLRQIAGREGIGDLLAEGVRRSAEQIGQGSESFAMHGKGLELGGWGCRAAFGQAIQYSLGSRGGCHHDLGLPAKIEYAAPDATTVAGKGAMVLRKGSERIALDSAIVCSFSEQYVRLEPIAKLISSVLGVEWSPDNLLRLGERALNLERLINVRAGVRRAADQLPARLLSEPLADGPRKGSTVPLEDLKTEYYTAAGWDIETGIPLPSTLARLDMGGDVMDRFHM